VRSPPPSLHLRPAHSCSSKAPNHPAPELQQGLTMLQLPAHQRGLCVAFSSKIVVLLSIPLASYLFISFRRPCYESMKIYSTFAHSEPFSRVKWQHTPCYRRWCCRVSRNSLLHQTRARAFTTGRIQCLTLGRRSEKIRFITTG